MQAAQDPGAESAVAMQREAAQHQAAESTVTTNTVVHDAIERAVVRNISKRCVIAGPAEAFASTYIAIRLAPRTVHASRCLGLALIALTACKSPNPVLGAHVPSVPTAAPATAQADALASATEAPSSKVEAEGPIAAKNQATGPATASSPKLATWLQKISGTTLDIELVSIPAGSIELDDPSTPDTKHTVEISAFSISKLEIPWEVYDAFVFGLDKPTPSTSDATDAVSRPSHPYITMDRGYGHAGYPAISVAFHGAQEFCHWLTIKSGRKYRLPSEAEWEYACRAGARTKYFFGDDPQSLALYAWYRDDAQTKTHPRGEKKPNAWGLFDMLGNAGEWCTAADGKGVVRGGSFRDDTDAVTCSARKPADAAWNRSDPQLPRGIWWLADGSFVGFRILCETPH